MKKQNMEEIKKELEFSSEDYQKWLPIFSRLGLKPRKYFRDGEAVYAGTADGWFRLSLTKYDKQELKWLRSILEHLDKRSFQNWAVSWQKTVIWEENSFCYLIQPWVITKETFQASDPASVSRVAEILVDFYLCGKDYSENRGLDVIRDRWQTIDLEWEFALDKLEKFKIDSEHEKTRKDLDELRKIAISQLNDSLNNWKKSGLASLMEHHRQTGVLGHGNLVASNIIWNINDYYLLNWESVAFLPRIVDLASLIDDVGWWETEWIIFLLHEYSKIQPFWPEEYSALFSLLKYPKKVIDLFSEDTNKDGIEKKSIKEVARELTKKERCLTKAWKELGTQKRWAWGKENGNRLNDQGKISMVLSPVESWGDFAGQIDSLIQVKHDQKLPSDVIERLTYQDPDRVVAGRDGNILESGAKNEANQYEENFIEIVEPQPKIPKEQELNYDSRPLSEKETLDITATKTESVPIQIEDTPSNAANTKAKDGATQMVRWANFPKPLGEKKKLGL